MIDFDTLLPTLAALSSLALAAAALIGRPRARVQWVFALGMVSFAAESMLALMLLGVGGVNGATLTWLRAVQVGGLAVVLAWGLFVLVLAGLQRQSLPRGWRIGRAVGVILAVTAGVGVMIWPAFAVGTTAWRESVAVLLPPARFAAMVQLLLTVAILAGLEACLRTARHESHRRVKYLVLGLGGIFLLRFYVLSQLLLFHVLAPVHLKTMAATLFIANGLLAIPIAQAQLRGASISVSRQVVYRSAVVGVLGVYLFAIGALGSLLSYLDVPEQTFWASVVVFVSALGLTAILLSDNVRWRVQRFIGLHLYRSKYDYREQWVAFTKRLGSLLTAEEIGPELADAVTQAVGATTGVVYLETDDGRYRRRGVVGSGTFEPVLDADAAVPTLLRSASGPVRVGADGALAVPLGWRTALLGFMILGPQRDGRDYGPEDLQFLSTIAEQAAGSVATIRLSEAVAHAREMDTFDRVSAAVIHDIKNSLSALALLSRNAARSFDDPEFRRDAITTLVRTVERMKRLLGRLSAPMGTAPLGSNRVDLADLLREALVPLSAYAQIRVVTDLQPVAEVWGDREALLRVVENLLTNATEAIDGEGTVTVRLYEEAGSAVIAVSDTGCGIPEEFRQRFLFSAFRSTKKGGWGIGLYHTKQVVERHYGQISVDSIEGQGTTFFVKLPLQEINVGETVR